MEGGNVRGSVKAPRGGGRYPTSRKERQPDGVKMTYLGWAQLLVNILSPRLRCCLPGVLV